tara:strand:- start:5129 stop:5599 length:471 start_codon:yes stop_codon:yes gene_type:complete
MYFLNDRKINYTIFDDILTLFPKFADTLKKGVTHLDKTIYGVGDVGDYDLNISLVSYSNEKECYLVSLFTDIEINNKLIKYPEIKIGLDLVNKRAEVLTYVSESYPYTTLNVYNKHEGKVYFNEMAHKDLSLFCCKWIENYIEKRHSIKWGKIKTA